MTRRIFRAIFLVAGAVLLACLMVVLGVLYEYFTGLQRAQLRAQTVLAAQGVEHEGARYFDGLDPGVYRLTWVAADGAVLCDSRAPASEMENHGDREEIKEALATGAGESERSSATLSERTLYYALRLTDGTVLRVSVTQYTVLSLVGGMIQPLLAVLAAAVILSAALAGRLSKRVVGPLNALDLDKPLENEAYAELSPLLTRIERQHRQIRSQMDALRRRQDEFAAVTGSMGEGLILLNARGTVLSINAAAARLFGAGADSAGKDILTIDRSLAMQRLDREAQGGQRGEAVMQLAGGVYQINASPVISDGRAEGVCILAFDITDRAQAEARRREFSANVSHELKTPLHAIMGSAELIENGLVKPEDLPRFVGRIRWEASRLVTLIDDIIRLSQLDEGGDLPREDVEVRALAEETAAALSARAAERRVSLAVHGDAVTVPGVRRLVHEIVYNLCDNAIKYNVENGRVDVTVSTGPDGEAVLTVADTGIGIPPEHQARVFERFYRVDKSHSRETGGTGLGLSIVKHAARYLGAAVELESEPGRGTTVRVRFPGKA